jgi:hypothetical protein
MSSVAPRGDIDSGSWRRDCVVVALVMVSVDPFRLSVPRVVDSLPDEAVLLSDARVPARLFPLRVLAAVAAVALPFGLGVGSGGFFSGIFFTGTTFFGTALLGVDVVDLNDVVETLFFKEAVGLRLAAVRPSFVLSIGGTGGRLTVLRALEIVDVTEASEVFLDLDSIVGVVTEFLVGAIFVGMAPTFLTLRFDAVLVLRSHSAVLKEVLASLTADDGLALETGRLAPVLDGGRNVEGPAAAVGGVLGRGIGFEMGLDLEVALDFLMVDAWLFTDDTLGAADFGLSVFGVVVLETTRRVFVGDVLVVVVGGMVTGCWSVDVGVLRSSASGGGVGVGVFLLSRVDIVDTLEELGVSLESGLGPGGGWLRFSGTALGVVEIVLRATDLTEAADEAVGVTFLVMFRLRTLARRDPMSLSPSPTIKDGLGPL